METKTLLVYVSMFVLGVILFPVIQQTVSTADMASWTFSGHEGIANFLNIFPYIFIISMVMTPVYLILKEKL